MMVIIYDINNNFIVYVFILYFVCLYIFIKGYYWVIKWIWYIDID